MCNENHKEWSSVLHDITLLLNYTVSDSLGVAPAQLHLNETEMIPLSGLLKLQTQFGEVIDWNDKLVMADVRRRERIQAKNAKINQKMEKRRSISVGDLVFLKSHYLSDGEKCKIKKFFNLFVGPYLCANHPSVNVITLIDPMTGKIIGNQSVTNCKLWKPSESTKNMWLKLVEKHVDAELFEKIKQSLKF
jgi:hypothetical protein